MDVQRVNRLAKEYREGNREAFDKIYSLTYDKQYYFAYKMLRNKSDAEDATQETYLRVYNKIESLKNPKAFLKWVYSINYNICMDMVKRNRTEENRCDIDDFTEVIEDDSADRSPERSLDRKEKNRTVNELLDAEPDSVRAAVVLKYYDGLREAEIADIVEIPVGTVKSRLNHFRGRMSKRLAGIYSVFPLFTLSHYLSSEAASMGISNMAILSTMVGKGITAIAVTAVVAGTGTIVLASGPRITGISLLNPDMPVSRQTLTVQADSIAGIASVVLNDGRELISAGTGYEISLDRNGEYAVVVTDRQGKTASRGISVGNIDTEGPEYTEFRQSDHAVSVLLSDKGSGIDWDSFRTEGKKEEEGTDYQIDRESGKVTIRNRELPVTFRLEDKAGNYSDFNITQQ